jgi:hypothetical protein
MGAFVPMVVNAKLTTSFCFVAISTLRYLPV